MSNKAIRNIHPVLHVVRIKGTNKCVSPWYGKRSQAESFMKNNGGLAEKYPGYAGNPLQDRSMWEIASFTLSELHNIEDIAT